MSELPTSQSTTPLNNKVFHKGLLFYYRHRWIVSGILIFIIILIGGYQIWVKKLWLQVSALRQDTVTSTSKIKELDERVSTIAKLIGNYQAISTDQISQVIKALPKDPQVAELYAILETLVGRNGGQVQSIDIVTKQDASQISSGGLNTGKQDSLFRALAQVPGVEQAQIKLQIKIPPQSYNSLKSIVRALETLRRFMDVKQYSFSYADSVDEQVLSSSSMTIPITIQTYYMKEL